MSKRPNITCLKVLSKGDVGVKGLGFRGLYGAGVGFLSDDYLGYCPPISNSRIINITWLYLALNRTPNIDCYWVGAVPNDYRP